MSRPRLLDLFAGAGGAGEGYRRAGFDVTAVDVEAHPDNPHDFIQADAVDVIADVEFLRSFDVLHASPPCQRWASVTPEHQRHQHPDLITPVRAAFEAAGRPYVIENVPRAPLRNPVLLCGSMFGLGTVCGDGVFRQLRRHRHFETSEWTVTYQCDHRGQPIGLYGTGGGGQMTRGYKATRTEAGPAIGIDWMRHEDVVQAIPPAYTEFLGSQLLASLADAR